MARKKKETYIFKKNPRPSDQKCLFLAILQGAVYYHSGVAPVIFRGHVDDPQGVLPHLRTIFQGEERTRMKDLKARPILSTRLPRQIDQTSEKAVHCHASGHVG